MEKQQLIEQTETAGKHLRMAIAHGLWLAANEYAEEIAHTTRLLALTEQQEKEEAA